METNTSLYGVIDKIEEFFNDTVKKYIRQYIAGEITGNDISGKVHVGIVNDIGGIFMSCKNGFRRFMCYPDGFDEELIHEQFMRTIPVIMGAISLNSAMSVAPVPVKTESGEILLYQYVIFSGVYCRELMFAHLTNINGLIRAIDIMVRYNVGTICLLDTMVNGKNLDIKDISAIHADIQSMSDESVKKVCEITNLNEEDMNFLKEFIECKNSFDTFEIIDESSVKITNWRLNNGKEV